MGGCCLYQSAHCHHLLFSSCEKFREGVTHLVLHTICLIAPISEQSASAVTWTHSCSILTEQRRQNASDLLFSSFKHSPESFTNHSHPLCAATTQTCRRGRVDSATQRSVIRGHERHLASHCVTSESNLLPCFYLLLLVLTQKSST